MWALQFAEPPLELIRRPQRGGAGPRGAASGKRGDDRPADRAPRARPPGRVRPRGSSVGELPCDRSPRLEAQDANAPRRLGTRRSGRGRAGRRNGARGVPQCLGRIDPDRGAWQLLVDSCPTRDTPCDGCSLRSTRSGRLIARQVRTPPALRRVLELAAVRLLKTAVERAQVLAAPSAHLVTLLQLAENVLLEPERAAQTLLGLREMNGYRDQLAAAVRAVTIRSPTDMPGSVIPSRPLPRLLRDALIGVECRRHLVACLARGAVFVVLYHRRARADALGQSAAGRRGSVAHDGAIGCQRRIAAAGSPDGSSISLRRRRARSSRRRGCASVSRPPIAAQTTAARSVPAWP